MRHEDIATLRHRLASWVAEKISGKRYAPIADAQITALQEALFVRGWAQVCCWCESCDTAANHGLRTRMSVCPDCGDKRCPRAAQHGNECCKTPNA